MAQFSVGANNALYGVQNWLAVFAFGILLGLGRDFGELSGAALSAGMTIVQLLSVNHPAIAVAKISLTLQVAMVVAIYWLLFTKHRKFRPVSSLLSAVQLACRRTALN